MEPCTVPLLAATLCLDGSRPMETAIMVPRIRGKSNRDLGCVYDYWATEHALPTLDTNQDLTLVRGWEESGNTVIEFIREITTAVSEAESLGVLAERLAR